MDGCRVAQFKFIVTALRLHIRFFPFVTQSEPLPCGVCLSVCAGLAELQINHGILLISLFLLHHAAQRL